jgi:hypothetical protein
MMLLFIFALTVILRSMVNQYGLHGKLEHRAINPHPALRREPVSDGHRSEVRHGRGQVSLRYPIGSFSRRRS